MKTEKELFRRGLAGATSALVSRTGIKVTFSNLESPSINQDNIALPLPPPKMSTGEIGKYRGAADSAALWLRYHDSNVHNLMAPMDTKSRKIFDACELARVESLGALQMNGVANNLNNNISHQLMLEGIEHPNKNEEFPIEWAIRLILQERIAPNSIPKVSKSLTKLSKPDIERKVGNRLNQLSLTISNQY